MRFPPLLAALCLGASSAAAAAEGGSPWRTADERLLAADPSERTIVPLRYRVVELDASALRGRLAQAPLEGATDAERVVVALPMPDGTDARFAVEESPLMEPALAARYPEVRTYRGRGIDDPHASTRFGWTARGFHAIVLAPSGTVYVDPYRSGDTTHYLTYFKRDYGPARTPFRCEMAGDAEPAEPATPEEESEAPAARIPSGDTLRTYRLAVAANVEYSDFHSTATPPLRADVINNGIVPSINRVSAIYERELAVRLVLVAGLESIIFVEEPDPYENDDAGQMLGANAAVINGAIGAANYDIGHVFSTGGGGVASLGVVCGSSKARGVTGRGQPIGDPFDVDYVAHEMGHQFGGSHTFNGNEQNCAGNRSGSFAYEVGSGSTIMAYAGICGSQDLQPNSDDYFHVASLVQIGNFLGGSGGTCPVATATGNQAPQVDAGPAFIIPSRTPFALTATGSDPDGHPLTFNWEEFDLGAAGDGRTDNGSSPILRPFLATPSPTRTFPRLSDLLAGTVTYGEILPTTTRAMRFRVTARDNRAGGGGTAFDETTVSVRATAGPFRVTSPNTAVSWIAGQPATVTWDVANTASTPISTAQVEIHLSINGGLTFPVLVSAATANDGTQAVVVPANPTTQARVRVRAVGNVFFDVSNVNFTILPPQGIPAPVSLAVDAAGNGVLQPGEATVLAPTWRNSGSAVLAGATGALSAFTGPAGGTYTVIDGAAAYGTLAAGAEASCEDEGNCYSVRASASTRPQQHWDAAVTETVTPGGVAKVWTLHVGDSFTDVSAGSSFYPFVETIFHRGVTGGCAAGTYCPANATTRAEVAVFALRAKNGASYAPPACATPQFADVPAASPFCPWIEELARRGVMSGCGGGNFCPGQAVTRDQMAVVMLATREAAGYAPPACGTPVFSDVPASSLFCPWIEELARRGVVAGCAAGLYCPSQPVTRGPMAVFLTTTFGLGLTAP